MALLYSQMRDGRRQGPLHPLVEKARRSCHSLCRSRRQLRLCHTHDQQKGSCALTLGILANRPARVSRMLVISKISISYNRIGRRKMRKDRGGRSPQKLQSRSQPVPLLGGLPPTGNTTGRDTPAADMPSGLAGAEGVVGCSMVRPGARCGLPERDQGLEPSCKPTG